MNKKVKDKDIDKKLVRSVNKNIKWTLRGENLLDARAMQVGGFGSPGRSFYAGLAYTFN